MKFFVRFFAIIGLIVTLSITAIGTCAYHFMQNGAEQEVPEEIILRLHLESPIAESAPFFPSELSFLFEDEMPTNFLNVINAIDRAAKDPKVKGIVATFGNEAPNLVQIHELREALARFRLSNKMTYAYAENYGLFGQTNRPYYLATAFENIWINPIGTVGLTALGIEAPFGKTALEKIGIKADILKREEYKAAMETITEDKFSPAAKENMTNILESFESQILQGLSNSLKISPEQAKALMQEGPYSANEALDKKLIAHLGYRDELETLLKGQTSEDLAFLSPEKYLALPKTPTTADPQKSIALIYASGAITDDEEINPMTLGQDSMNTQSIIKSFKAAAKDEDVKAILFRVNSPGGSATASDAMRYAMIEAKKSGKPIFVSMGDVAASGGYWIAMEADRIFADPSTLTGSIGVIMGKINIAGLLEKMGIAFDHIETGDNAHTWSFVTPFSPKTRAKLENFLDETYKVFTDHVARARKLDPKTKNIFAKGQVFTGAQAIKIGLVDELGGLKTTLNALKKEIGLKEDDKVMLKIFPEPESPASFILSTFKMLKSSAKLNQASGIIARSSVTSDDFIK